MSRDPGSGDGDETGFFDELAGSLRSRPPEPARREALRARVLDAARAAAPEGTATARGAEMPWIALAPKVEMKVLRRDAATRTQSVLLRVAAGGRIPGHRHTLEEEFIILEGECHVGSHRLGAGDAHIAAPGSWHDDITTQTGTLVFVRGEYQPDIHV
jgi:quercetin dioxygenase-like cupin family protein